MKPISIPEAEAGVSRCAILHEVTESAATKEERGRVGLCFDCVHSQRIQSPRGSTFYRCKLSDSDPNFAKYPRLPVLHCVGYARRVESREKKTT